MRAARLYGYNEDYVVEDIPVPEPGPGQVLVGVAGSGACHSDLHMWRGDMAGRPLPPFPWVLGHENAGYVEALGPVSVASRLASRWRCSAGGDAGRAGSA